MSLSLDVVHVIAALRKVQRRYPATGPAGGEIARAIIGNDRAHEALDQAIDAVIELAMQASAHSSRNEPYEVLDLKDCKCEPEPVGPEAVRLEGHPRRDCPIRVALVRAANA